MAHLEDAIPGLAEFTRWFAEDATRYVVIGGVAREMIYREAGLWEESGTALYVFDEADLRHRMEAYREAFRSRYENSDIIYASKAFLNKEVVRIAEAEGLCLDVSGGGVRLLLL